MLRDERDYLHQKQTKNINPIILQNIQIIIWKTQVVKSMSGYHLQYNYIKDIFSQITIDAQGLSQQIRNLQQQMDSLRSSVEKRNQMCYNQMHPKIKQLHSKMSIYQDSLQKDNQIAWEDLQRQTQKMKKCYDQMKGLQTLIDHVHQNM